MAHRIISEIAKVFTRNSDNLYAPLDAGSKTIRLLRLMPGAWQEDIRAQLLECTITDARDSYIAISYAWGHADVVPQVPIECNSRAVYISENLFTAFRALRRHDHWILLWADALCINQADTLERTIQVGLMGEIYSGSTETVIWLGELPTHDKLSSGPMNSGALSRHFSQSQTTWTGDSRDDSLLNAYLADLALSPMAGFNDAATANTGPDIFGAFCLIQDFAGNIFHPVLEALNHERTFALRSHGISSSWHGLVLAKNYVRGSKSSRVWEGLAKLMSRPWWQRVWIVQETVLASKATIRYGAFSAPWSMFAKAAANYVQQRHMLCLDLAGTFQGQDILDQFSNFVLRIEDTRLHYHARSSSATTLQLLWKFRPLQATDKRDKVFALLGITTNWQGLPPLMPDYKYSAAITFTNTAIDNIRRAVSLSVLAGDLEAVLNRKRESGIPSWVMDWSLPCLPTEVERVGALRMYDAAKGQKATVRYNPTNQLLEVEGVCIGSVTTVGEVSRHSQISDTRAVIRSWSLLVRSLDQVGSMGLTGGNYEDAFWRTLIGDMLYVDTALGTRAMQDSYRRATTEDHEAYRAWDMWSRCISRDTFSRTASFSQRDLDEGISTIHHTLKTVTASRRFFMTSSGHMGMGPKSTSEGDKVYVLKSSNIPFVVRQNQSVLVNHDDWTVVLAGEGRKSHARTGAKRPEPSFSLVGDCFVHGVMDGEVFAHDDVNCTKLYLA